jgi:hypothetical protein
MPINTQVYGQNPLAFSNWDRPTSWAYSTRNGVGGFDLPLGLEDPPVNYNRAWDRSKRGVERRFNPRMPRYRRH